METKHREAEVYEAVRLGLLEVRLDGTVWKLAELRGNRWNGRKSLRRVKPRRAEHDQGQYLQVRRMTGTQRYSCLAHRLVWRHFNGPIPGKLTINHINGRKKDNRPSNLELATPSEQMKHAYRTGLKTQDGQSNPAAKLTDNQVEAVRTIYAAGGITQATLAAQFQVTFQAISKIVRGARRPKQCGPTADYTCRRQHTNKHRNTKGQFRSA